MSSYESTMNTKEACQALKVCKAKLRQLRKVGLLIYGTHYFKHLGTYRYHPDLARLCIEQPGEVTIESLIETDSAPENISPKQRDKEKTRTFFGGN